MAEPAPLQLALAAATAALRDEKRKYALVGGLAVSVRAEVRFTRDIDLAVGVSDDADAEHLIFALQNRGYQPIATVEHDVRKRLSTIRLLSPQKIKVDLLFASSGIEPEAIDRATAVPLPQVGDIPVAAAEELLAMKVLSMTDRRLQDRIDAQRLLECNPSLDIARVRGDLTLISERGYDRGEPLAQKLDALLRR